MRRPVPLVLAIFLSLVVHLGSLGVPGWERPEMPTEAPRLVANLRQTPALAAQANAQSSTLPVPVVPQRERRKSPPPPEGAPTARLPPLPEQSSPADMETVHSQPIVADSIPPAEASAPPAAGSEPVADASEPSPESSGVEADQVLMPASQRLPSQGRVAYAGTAGGFIALTATGQATWEHDGVHFQSRLSAGLSSPDSSLDYRSTGRLIDLQMISETTNDNRRGKVSSSLIDQQGGKVVMQRGSDTRERQIRGLAVALSALPEMLMTLDESVDKAAFFVVGDFWVDDAVVVQRGKEYLRLPVGRVEARHFATQTKKGDLIDVWLAPQWRNAPVRIRIEAGGVVVDLNATEVEIERKRVVSYPEMP
jgi:hypothetical protein